MSENGESDEVKNNSSEKSLIVSESKSEIEVPDADHYFEVIDGRPFVFQRDRKGIFIPVCLANFMAVIIREVTEIDGLAEKKVLHIKGTLFDGTDLGTAAVAIEAFSGMSWILPSFGARAALTGAPFVSNYVREAIQLLSTSIERQTVYKRPGWICLDEKWMYVHSGGAISGIGEVDNIMVDFGDSTLSCYRLASPPVNPEQQRVVRLALDLLNVAPDRITIPLLCTVAAAPLCTIKPADYFPFAVGPSGVRKTALMAIFQAFFGRDFGQRNLPGSWSSTANAIEMLLSLAKDCLCILDDFAPTGTRFDVDKIHTKAESVIRKIRNRDHRARLRADLTFRPEMRCNGLPVGTGEDRPRGYSLQAGMLFIEFTMGDVDLDRLTVAQKLAADGVYEKVMSAYIKYLASRMDGLKKDLPKRCEMYRQTIAKTDGHLRTPDAIASLEAGFSVFLDFAQATLSITAEERYQYANRGREALLKLAETQVSAHSNQDPCTRFIELLGACFYQAHLDDGNGGMPVPHTNILGWKKQDSSYGGAFKPCGQRIGWLNDRELCLHSDLAYAEVQKLAIRQGSPIPLDVGTLWKRLGESGLILRDESDGKYSLKRQPRGGTRRRFRVMLLDTLLNGTKAAEANDEAPGVDTDEANRVH